MKWYAKDGPTPAPHHQGQVADEETGRTIAVTYDDPDGSIARKLAAAPSLYSALKELRDDLHEHARFMEIDEAEAGMLDRANKALAQAAPR